MYRWIPYQHEAQYVNQWHFSNENKMLQHHSVFFLLVVKLFLTEIPVLAVRLICMKICSLNSETQSVCYAVPHPNLEGKKCSFHVWGLSSVFTGSCYFLYLCWSVVSNVFLNFFLKTRTQVDRSWKKTTTGNSSIFICGWTTEITAIFRDSKVSSFLRTQMCWCISWMASSHAQEELVSNCVVS